KGIMSLGSSFRDRRVRSIVRDGEKGLDALLKGSVFCDAVVTRCETHIRKNITDRFGESGHALATFPCRHCYSNLFRMAVFISVENGDDEAIRHAAILTSKGA
ncbi:hypothetical protein PMAYCL1PPCAC_28548, partial [Pristionchus mayeri]